MFKNQLLEQFLTRTSLSNLTHCVIESVFSPNTGKYGPGKTPYLKFFPTVTREHKESREQEPLHQERSFPLRISSVNVTKSAVFCEFSHIYWKNPSWKTSFFNFLCRSELVRNRDRKAPRVQLQKNMGNMRLRKLIPPPPLNETHLDVVRGLI